MPFPLSYSDGKVGIGKTIPTTDLDVQGSVAISGSLTVAGAAVSGVSLGVVGSTPNANAATLVAGVLALQPASAAFPGVVTIGAQTFAGAKTFSSAIIDAVGFVKDTTTLGMTFNGADVRVRHQGATGDILLGDDFGEVHIAVNSSGIDFTRGFSTTQTVKFNYTDSSGTPGNATINKPQGRSAIAAAAAAVTITSSVCTTTSHVTITPEDLDVTLLTFKCVPGAGSFVVTGNAAATATWKFRWTILSSG